MQYDSGSCGCHKAYETCYSGVAARLFVVTGQNPEQLWQQAAGSTIGL